MLKVREMKKKTPKRNVSYEGTSIAVRRWLEFVFPWMRHKEEGEVSFLTKSGAWRHGNYSPAEYASFAGVAITVVGCVVLTVRYFMAFFGLQRTVVVRNLLFALVMAAIPIAMWARATDENFWAYHRRKRVFFALALTRGAVPASAPLFRHVVARRAFRHKKRAR